MYRTLIAAGLLTVLGAFSPANAEGTRSVDVQTGHSIVLDEPSVARVAVGDRGIVSVRAVGDSQLLVTGRAPGHTTAILWVNGRRHVLQIDVTEDAADRLAAMVKSAIPFDAVSVQAFDRALVVRGAVDDPRQLLVVNDVLARFDKLAAARKYAVVNAVTVTHPLGTLQDRIAAVAGPDVHVDSDGKGGLIVSGPVPDRTRAEWVLARVRGLAGPYLAVDAKVTDRLDVATVSQVDVKVRVYEVDKTALDQLGVSLQTAVPNDPLNPTQYTIGGPSIPIVETGTKLAIGAFVRTTRLAPTLDLLVQRGDAKMLSEPDLITLPGAAASFLVGGEIPIPYTTGVGQTSIVFKEYGVRLNITPTLLGSGAVEAKVTPEVSDLDFQDGLSSGGFVIPSLRTSRLTTDVVTQSGESIVLGGMMRHVEQRTVQKIPVLSSLPVIGQLFKSTRYQNDQTDIVFVMTPTVVTK
ncbi:MAG TPA: pilus assembly protein N-terminal domain-containing protein [Candidatus Elarobacter sp.]|jgi:pilus assembly protein CpaC|nr:pilus assembly protein N-terminal domain-containing protein [Candidatus Elarobacter sp.]